MFPGVGCLMKRIIFFACIFSLFIFSYSQAQDQSAQVTKDQKEIYAVVKDGQGETVEGFLHLNSDEVTVRSKDNEEKSIPVKYIKSITLEKVQEVFPGKETIKSPNYSVRLQNSQDIYKVDKKYTFSLNTKLGVVTKSIDPEELNNIFSKDAHSTTGPNDRESFIQDKSIVFSLELKF
jgi:hypothetical protein